MRYVPFGKTGVDVSQLCLGTMMFGARCDERESDAILGTALDRGVDFIDTAAMYADGRTEEILGRILAGRRDRFFITTKVNRGTDGATIRASIDESLKRMQTDHVDLYLIHWPAVAMRAAEMMEALNSVVVAGKTRFVGFSNCPAWLFAHFNMLAMQHGWAPLVCNQVPYNLFERGIEVEILPQAAAEGIAITTYRALAIGLLAGKYAAGAALPANTRGQDDKRVADWLTRFGDGVEKFKGIAAEMGVPPAHLATAWVCGQEGVTASMVGVSSLAQLQTAADGFDLTLTSEQRARVSSLFDTEVKEESGGRFPPLRRAFGLLDKP